MDPIFENTSTLQNQHIFGTVPTSRIYIESGFGHDSWVHILWLYYTPPPSSNISPFNISNVYNKMNSSCAQLILFNVKPDLIRALRIVKTSCQPEDKNNNKAPQIKT